MHKLKRVLALILAAAMILGYAPKSVRADGFADSAPAEEVVTEETAEEKSFAAESAGADRDTRGHAGEEPRVLFAL